MGIISRIGAFLDKRFPEKISAEEVYKSLAAYQGLHAEVAILRASFDLIDRRLLAFTTGAQAFDKELREMKDEMNKAKSVLAIMNRTRTAPVMPSGEPWKR